MSRFTAAQNYLYRLYESCVDRSLDLTQIRLHLASRGIPRTPAQVVRDLDHVFAFAGYVSSHKPKRSLSVQEFDANIGR